MKISKINSINIQTELGPATLHLYKQADLQYAYALVYKSKKRNCLVRIHSACITSEIFGDANCDCKQQLESAKKNISKEGGVLIYLPQEGRGNGIEAKFTQMRLEYEDPTLDTVTAYKKLNLNPDTRSYDVAISILKDLKVFDIQLLTNNPQKITSLINHFTSVKKKNFRIEKISDLAKKNLLAKKKSWKESKYTATK